MVVGVKQFYHFCDLPACFSNELAAFTISGLKMVNFNWTAYKNMLFMPWCSHIVSKYAKGGPTHLWSSWYAKCQCQKCRKYIAPDFVLENEYLMSFTYHPYDIKHAKKSYFNLLDLAFIISKLKKITPRNWFY